MRCGCRRNRDRINTDRRAVPRLRKAELPGLCHQFQVNGLPEFQQAPKAYESPPGSIH